MRCSSSYNLRESRWKFRVNVSVPEKTKNPQMPKYCEGREKARNTACGDGCSFSGALCGKPGDRFEVGEE